MNFNIFLKTEEIKYGTSRKKWSKSLITSTFSIFLGFLVALFIASLVGYNPVELFGRLFTDGFENENQLIYQFGTLALAGFAFAFASRVGIFNIGISGQMLAAGTAVVLVTAIWIPENSVPNGAGQIITLIVAMLTGAIIALVTGLIETYLKVNSVVVAIILNWIIYFVSYYILANNEPRSISPGAPITSSAAIPDEFRFYDNNADIEGLLPILLTVFVIGAIMFIVFKFTTFGHKAKATGLSIDASRFAGYNVKFIKITTFVISGAISGILAIILYTSGTTPYISLSQSVDVVPIEGFNGIAIALIAFNNPLAIIGISGLIGLFRTSSLTIFTTDPSYADLLIGFLLLGAALSVLFSQLRPILKLKSWKYGNDILQANDALENGLNANIFKYYELYDQTRKKIFASKNNSQIEKEKIWEKVSLEIKEDYLKERYFIQESYMISKIYSWIEHSKSKSKLKEDRNAIQQEILKIKNIDVKNELQILLKNYANK